MFDFFITPKIIGRYRWGMVFSFKKNLKRGKANNDSATRHISAYKQV
jgi:hypothetical protein